MRRVIENLFSISEKFSICHNYDQRNMTETLETKLAV